MPFFSMKVFSHDVLLGLVKKIKQTCVLLFLEKCHSIITSFDFWIFKGAHNVFAFVIIFLGFNWKPKHVTIGLFEAFITKQVLTKKT